MFERLFRQCAAARHRSGPLASSREQFLAHCAAEGHTRRGLRKIAWLLLVVAQSLRTHKGNVSIPEIKQAARCRFKIRKAANREARSTRQPFIHVATAWLKFQGRLEPPTARCGHLASKIEAFARFMREERGLSSVTITSRRQRIDNFLAALHPRSIKQITIWQVDRYLIHQGNNGWSRPSMAALASDLRSFFRYAETRGWCDAGIAAAIDSPRIYALEGLPRGPTWKQVQHLIASTEGNRPTDIRDRAIIMLLALYALRRGEVARLRLEDIDWTNEILRVIRPKQRRIQRYPFIRPVGDAIVRYLREVRPRCACREIFLALKAPFRPLSPGAVTPIVRSRLVALGVQLPRRGAHSLRHACAQHLLSCGFSLKQIGDQLGHRHASTTLNYTKIDLEGLRQVAELDLRKLL
jgi:site-specific recombinase XerD